MDIRGAFNPNGGPGSIHGCPVGSRPSLSSRKNLPNDVVFEILSWCAKQHVPDLALSAPAPRRAQAQTRRGFNARKTADIYFTAPAVMPLMNCFCMAKNISRMGIMESTEPAATSRKLESKACAICERPTESG